MRGAILGALAALAASIANAAETYRPPTIVARPATTERQTVVPEPLLRENKYGGASFSCKMTLNGVLANCILLNEIPQGIGVEAAARSLLPGYRGAPAKKAGVLQAGNLLLTIQLNTPPAEAGSLGLPLRAEIIASAPPGAIALGSESNVALSCVSKATGGLESCQAVSADGLDQTFVQAALSMAAKAKATPRIVSGQPTTTLVDVNINWNALPFDVPSTWLKRPDASAISLTYPKEAGRQRVTGEALISCTITPAGTLAECEVDYEYPRGWEFGRAALDVSRWFSFKPAMKDGKAVSSEVRIPINFGVPGASR